MNKKINYFKKFILEIKAVAAVEFAVTMPLMMAAIYGAYELVNFVLVNNKVYETAYVVAEALADSRVTLGPTEPTVATILNAIPTYTLARYNKNITIQVQAVDVSGLRWTYDWSGTSPAGSGTLSSYSTGAPASSGSITVSVSYVYVPRLSSTFLSTSGGTAPNLSTTIRQQVVSGVANSSVPVLA